MAVNTKLAVSKKEYVVRKPPFWKFWQKDVIELLTYNDTEIVIVGDEDTPYTPAFVYSSVAWGFEYLGAGYKAACEATDSIMLSINDRSPVVVTTERGTLKRVLTLEVVKTDD